MSTAVFTWDVAAPVEEPERLFDRSVSEDGIVATVDLVANARIVVAAVVPFPNASGGTWRQLFDFYEARGHSDSFLYKAQDPDFKTVTGGALGTGDGSATVFKFSAGTSLHRHLDLTTLKVYVNAVLQTITTDYTVAGNNTDPTITFVVAPGNTLAVTVDYDYYLSVVWDAAPTNPFVRSDLLVKRSEVRFSEWKAAERFAA